MDDYQNQSVESQCEDSSHSSELQGQPQFLTYSQMQNMMIFEEPVIPEDETFSQQIQTKSISSNIGSSFQEKCPINNSEKSGVMYVAQSMYNPKVMTSSDKTNYDELSLTYSVSQVAPSALYKEKMPNIDEVSGDDRSVSNAPKDQSPAIKFPQQLNMENKAIIDKNALNQMIQQLRSKDSQIYNLKTEIDNITKDKCDLENLIKQSADALHEIRQQFEFVLNDNKSLRQKLSRKNMRIQLLEKQRKVETDQIDKLYKDLQNQKKKENYLKDKLQQFESNKNTNVLPKQDPESTVISFRQKGEATVKNLILRLKKEEQILRKVSEGIHNICEDFDRSPPKYFDYSEMCSPTEKKQYENSNIFAEYTSNNSFQLFAKSRSLQRFYDQVTPQKKPISSYLAYKESIAQNLPYKGHDFFLKHSPKSFLNKPINLNILNYTLRSHAKDRLFNQRNKFDKKLFS